MENPEFVILTKSKASKISSILFERADRELLHSINKIQPEVKSKINIAYRLPKIDNGINAAFVGIPKGRAIFGAIGITALLSGIVWTSIMASGKKVFISTSSKLNIDFISI